MVANHGLEYKDIKLSTAGIIFLGTPHEGSDVAGYGALLLQPFQNLTSKVDTELVKSLSTKSRQLHDLSRDFWAEYMDLDIVCYYETETRNIAGIFNIQVN